MPRAKEEKPLSAREQRRREREAANKDTSSRRGKASAEDKPARKPRASRPKVDEEKPARKPRASRESATEEKPSRKSRTAIEETPKKSSRASRYVKDGEEGGGKSDAFNPLSDFDDVVDSIEKHVGITDGTLDPSEKRMSTGMLMQDIMLGGGITAGWYTNFGAEQSCKTTDALSIMAASIPSTVPLRAYWDYEGCLTGETEVKVNGHVTTLGELAQRYKVSAGQGAALDTEMLYVRTAYGMGLITFLFNKGPKPITKVCLSNGQSFRGFSHPVFVVEGDNIVVKKHEDLKVGDVLLTPA